MNLDLIAIKPVSSHDDSVIDAQHSENAPVAGAKNTATNNIANQQTAFLSVSPQGTLQKNFGEMQSGVKFCFEDGQLVLNGLNISTYIATCRAYPTPKSKIFLRGIKKRLHHVLQNRASLGIHDAVSYLFAEIDDVLG